MPAAALLTPSDRACVLDTLSLPSLQLPPEGLSRIKSCSALVKSLSSLKEGNIEFLTVDSRTMITEHPLAAVRDA